MTPIYFLLLPNTLLLDVIGPAEVFAYANKLAAPTPTPTTTTTNKKPLYQLHFIGPQTQLENSLALNIQIDPLPPSIPANAWLFVPGLTGEQVELNTPAMKASEQWLQDKHFEKVISVCSGALVLAQAGLLTHKQCTTHHDHICELQHQLSEKQVLDNRLFVEDGNTYTSAGITSGIDLTLYLIQQHHSPNLATKIAKKMVLFTRRSSQDASHSPWLENRNHLNHKIHAVQDKIQADPAKAWSLTELAAIAHCSERHLVRLFKLETSLTTKEYIYKLRLTLAQQLLQNSQLTVENIAARCGFNDDRQFRRLWSRHYAQPPSAYR